MSIQLIFFSSSQLAAMLQRQLDKGHLLAARRV